MTNIEDRISSAIDRITSGHGCMRIPAENTDPDLVLADCKAEITHLRSALAAKSAEVEGLAKDAERYRWLRQQERHEDFKLERRVSVEINDWGHNLSEKRSQLNAWSSAQISREQMDAIIDAEMEKSNEQEGKSVAQKPPQRPVIDVDWSRDDDRGWRGDADSFGTLDGRFE